MGGGRITVDGADLRDIDPAAWQRRVAAIFQDFVQYPVSAHDNVAFGALDRLGDRDAVETAARRAGAADVVAALPKGWDTPLSRQLTDGAGPVGWGVAADGAGPGPVRGLGRGGRAGAG